MINILSRIDGYTAKGIYTLIYLYGTVTLEDLMNAGYKESIALIALRNLQKGGNIERVGRGVYRVSNCNRLQLDRNILQEGQTATGCGTTVTGYSLGANCNILQEGETATGCGTDVAGYSLTATGCSLVGSSVNVVNVVNVTNERNGKSSKISSTGELVSFIEGLSVDETGKYLQVYKVMQGIISFVVSPDIVQRLTAIPFVFGIPMPIDLIHEWIKEAKRAEKIGKVRVAWMAFAQNVKRFYEEFGVKWTKCRPVAVVSAANKLKALKVVTPGGEQSALDFLSFSDCDNMERFVKGTMSSPAPPIPAESSEPRKTFGELCAERKKLRQSERERGNPGG